MLQSMKNKFVIVLFFVLVACEDQYEVTHKYSRLISQSKTYPVYLDMSEIGNIQVKNSAIPATPFKIVSNDKYYFVGDMMKGVHVYKMQGEYLCFIECKYIKAFDVIDDFLFCNNFVDLVVLDVTNPLQTTVRHREINHFNRFSCSGEPWNIPSSYEYWNIPYEEGKGCVVGHQQYTLTGIVTEQQPELDFSEYDQLYGHLTTTDIPESWTTNFPENDKPYTGIIKVGDDRIYTYGKCQSWTIYTFQGGIFRKTEEHHWTDPRGNYHPPTYYGNTRPVRMINKDGIIYIMNTLSYQPASTGLFDCIMYSESIYVQSYYSLYQPDYACIDATYIASLKTFFVLTRNSIRTVSIAEDNPHMHKYLEYNILHGAVTIIEAQEKLITLGDGLSVYIPTENGIQFLKKYPDISGTSMMKNGNILIVAHKQGLSFYDISDLGNIKLVK